MNFSPPHSAPSAEPRLDTQSKSGMATAESNPADSELAFSFGAGGVGFDFLPLELANDSDAAPLPRGPAPKLPVIGLDSRGPMPAVAEPRTENSEQATKKNGRPRAPERIWLNGDVVLCACPDCQAPVSVRFWLMAADCWRCAASIELTEEQERQAQEMLAGRERQSPVATPPAPPRPRAPQPGPVSPATRQEPAQPQAPALPPTAAPRRQGPASPPRSAQRQRPPAAPAQERAAEAAAILREPWLRHLLNDTPAWLISMLAHMVLLTVLALLTTEKEAHEGPLIVLSANYSRVPEEGGDTVRMPPDERAKFDLPLPSKADLNSERQREALLAAANDARELRLDDDTPNLPDLQVIKSKLGAADGYSQAMAARDPRLRVEMVTREGGTTLTEAAVARGLRWLTNHQNADGSWSLAGFNRAGDCSCSGDGAYRTRAPGTALAMLPYLGAGQTHLAGKYKGTVSRGLRWLIQNQEEDGDLRAGAHGNEGMYAHGQAAIVLCEAFAMTGDEELRLPAQKAINFIVKAQYNDGGWRYSPAPGSQRGDTSVVGWQLMALQSARAANLTVPEETWGLANHYFDGVQHDGGAFYSYQSRGSPTPTMTAEALLCRMYLGWTKEQPGLLRGARALAEDHLPSRGSPNIYYWYYATQVMHHIGGQEWEDWNTRMRDVLVSSQQPGGHAAGSWAPAGDHASAGGRIYMTALAICTLEVYYRHLPIFRQIELGEGGGTE